MIPKAALPQQDEYYDDEEDFDNYDSEDYYDEEDQDDQDDSSEDGLFDDEPEQELQYGQHSKPLQQQQPTPVSLQ